MAKKTRKPKSGMPKCDCMRDVHTVNLTTVEVLSIVSAATHGVRCGYDDAPLFLQDGINQLLNQCNIDCTFKKDGTMVLTYGKGCK